MNISVVVPAYNESDNIKTTIQELLSIIRSIHDVEKIQIIIVDDHSSDNTYNVVEQLQEKEISSLRLSRRSGSHTAIRAGLREATGDVILCISADGQDDASCFEKMLDKWRDGAQIVWALRDNREDETFISKISAQFFYKILKWLGGHADSKFDLSRADFYLLDRAVVNAINACIERNTSLFGLIVWLGFNQDFVEYKRRFRRYGKSKWNFRSRIRLAKDWIVAFSGIPLRLITVIGFLFAAMGFLFSIYLFLVYLLSKNVQGWTSIMVGILVLGGIQMMMLGIMGEYLWRNLDESRRRPLFFIEKKTTNKDGIKHL